MHLLAAIVPPDAVIDEVLEFAGRVDARVAAGTSAAYQGGPAVATASVDRPVRASSDRLYLHVAGFGRATVGESERLAKALKATAVDLAPATVWVGGAELVEDGATRSVCAKLEGDVDAVRDVARAMDECARRLGFLIDRRRFRLVPPLATVPAATPEATLRGLVERLDGFHGASWRVEEVSFRKRSYDAASGEFVELDRIPLGRLS